MMEKCKICDIEFKTNAGLLQHIRYSHKDMTKKIYYDTFFKKDGEGICPVCGKETNFFRYGWGYNKHCSIQCTNKNPETIKKIEETKLKKYGVTNNTKLDYYKKLNSEIWKNKSIEELEKIKEKSRKSCLEKYGVDNPAKFEETKQKMKKTCLEKYGVECVLESKDVIEKRKKNLIDKYGIENIFQHPDIIEKNRQLMIEKGYWSDKKYYSKLKKYYLKCQNLTKKNIRKFNFKENWNGYDYYDGEYIKENYILCDQNNEKYPNIDHKISIVYGFLNNISVENICSVENLCFTKRKHNMAKMTKTEDEYKNIIKKVVNNHHFLNLI